MDEEGRPRDRAGRRPKRVPDAEAEVRVLPAGGPRRGHDGGGRGRRSNADPAVARHGALSAAAESRPGTNAGTRDVELDAAKAEIARLSETVKKIAVKLMLVEGKGGWDRWPHFKCMKTVRVENRSMIC